MTGLHYWLYDRTQAFRENHHVITIGFNYYEKVINRKVWVKCHYNFELWENLKNVWWLIYQNKLTPELTVRIPNISGITVNIWLTETRVCKELVSKCYTFIYFGSIPCIYSISVTRTHFKSFITSIITKKPFNMDHFSSFIMDIDRNSYESFPDLKHPNL